MVTKIRIEAFLCYSIKTAYHVVRKRSTQTFSVFLNIFPNSVILTKWRTCNCENVSKL